MGTRNGNQIIIDQVNINSVNNKKTELGLLADKRKNSCAHVIFLNDTRLTKSKSLKIKGYRTLRKDHHSGKARPGGVAILAKNEIKFSEVTCDIDEMLLIEIDCGGYALRIGTLYLHPGELMQQRHFDAAFHDQTSARTTTVIMGDLNAHTGLGKKRKLDRAGIVLKNLAESNGFRIANDDSPTFYATNCNTSSCIDICLIKSHASSMTCSWKTDGECGSDHLITSLSLDFHIKAESRKIVTTNWANVREQLKSFQPILRLSSRMEVEESIESFGRGLREAVEASSKTKRVMTRDNVCLSKHTEDLIKIRRKLNKIRKEWENDDKPTEVIRHMGNILNKDIKRNIKREVEANLAQKITEITEEKDAAKSWRSLKDIAPCIGKTRSSLVSNGIEDANGNLQKEDTTIASVHADRLSNAHSFPAAPHFSVENLNKVNDELKNVNLAADFSKIDEVTLNGPGSQFEDENRIGRYGKRYPPIFHPDRITTNEILHHLKRKKNKSAGGEDRITYKLLKHCSRNLLQNLARLFTVLLVAGYFPECWKTVRISMIPKPGKDLKKSKNWRPISLSSCLSKIMECCIKERIEIERSKRRIKDNIYQAAYKQGRSTHEHVLRLSEDVMHAFAHQQSTMAVFLDVSAAFDKVWVQGLIWKVMKLQLPRPLLSIIYGFLTGRSLKVKVGEATSTNIKMEAGTPQGAVLSPTLFNIFMDDLVDCLSSDQSIKLAQYADDIAIWTSDSCPKSAELRVNMALKRIAEWTSKWRISLAPEKSVFMLFSRRPTHRRETFDLRLFGEKIQRVPSHRFLGVKFDDKLSWTSQVDEMLGAAMPRINALKSLAAKSIWQHTDWILKVHNAVVNSIWKYGAPAFSSMGPHLWDKITKSHARAVRSYAGVPNFVNYETICDHLGINSIKDEIISFARKRIKNIISFSPFGRELLNARRSTVHGIYKSVTEVVISNEDAEFMRST